MGIESGRTEGLAAGLVVGSEEGCRNGCVDACTVGDGRGLFVVCADGRPMAGHWADG